ncbi:uncharacterized protein LOC128671670 isoform X2 [Plodia interpunctella]|uniref:uncharacterized protein LOC128671670 isoform X2 n=1 Tax=Plodia interpunctella TaxID=58824 RepID=UPI002367F8FC|nr:uncharacterized protein LOC128671670 isoform X2 [Plodia interpunctella]
MNVWLRFFLLVSAVSYINTDVPVVVDDEPRKPDRCHGNINMLNEQCCLLPPFFARDVAQKCGGHFSVINNDVKNNITYRRRHLIEGCESWTCIVTQYKFVTKEGDFDDEKYYAHLDRTVR